MDFSDLELMVRDLFRARAALAEAVGRRYDAVLVDEFQDTNRVQFEILEAIDRDNRCVVGDTFQSIYRFRHADVELFDEERARLAGRDGELHLGTNFRSAEPLLDAINAAVGGRVGAGFIPLRAGRADLEPDGPPALVELLVTDSAGWKGDDQQEPVDFGATLPARSCGASPRLGCWASACVSCSTARGMSRATWPCCCARRPTSRCSSAPSRRKACRRI